MPSAQGPAGGPEREGNHRTEAEADDPERGDGREQDDGRSAWLRAPRTRSRRRAERRRVGRSVPRADPRRSATPPSLLRTPRRRDPPRSRRHPPTRAGRRRSTRPRSPPPGRSPRRQGTARGGPGVELVWGAFASSGRSAAPSFGASSGASSGASVSSGNHRRNTLLTRTTNPAQIGRWISIGTPAAMPADASAAPTNRATLHVPWIADITRRSNRRSTATASMFIATSIRPANKPIAEEEQRERREVPCPRQEREPDTHHGDTAADDPSATPTSDRRVRHPGPCQEPDGEPRQGDPESGSIQSRLGLDAWDPRPEEAGQHRVRRERGGDPHPCTPHRALILAGDRHRESLGERPRTGTSEAVR